MPVDPWVLSGILRCLLTPGQKRPLIAGYVCQEFRWLIRTRVTDLHLAAVISDQSSGSYPVSPSPREAQLEMKKTSPHQWGSLLI